MCCWSTPVPIFQKRDFKIIVSDDYIIPSCWFGHDMIVVSIFLNRTPYYLNSCRTHKACSYFSISLLPKIFVNTSSTYWNMLMRDHMFHEFSTFSISHHFSVVPVISWSLMVAHHDWSFIFNPVPREPKSFIVIQIVFQFHSLISLGFLHWPNTLSSS